MDYRHRTIISAVAITACGLAALADGPATPISGREYNRYSELNFNPLHRLSDADFAEYLTLYNRALDRDGKLRTPADRIATAARRTMGRPYRLNAPMFSRAEADCVTFVEHTLALALTDSWDSYHQLIARLRYVNGDIPFPINEFSIVGGQIMPFQRAREREALLNRNHFIVSEWNINNAWLFEDITRQLGEGEIKPWIPLHHIVRRKDFFAKNGLEVDVPDQKVVDAFIPREAVEGILDELREGDIVQVIRGTLENRYCDHIGIMSYEPWWPSEWGPWYMLYAAPNKVQREPIRLFLERFKFVEGFKFLRLRPDAPEAVRRETAAMASRMNVTPPTEALPSQTSRPAD